MAFKTTFPDSNENILTFFLYLFTYCLCQETVEKQIKCDQYKPRANTSIKKASNVNEMENAVRI